MEVMIKGEPTEMLINTVSLTPPRDNNDLFMFHCTQCGNTVQQYQGKVVKIYPFMEPQESALVVAQCRRCKGHYNFQTHRYYKTQVAKVLLHSQISGKSFFFCPAGKGDPMLIFSPTEVYSFVERKQKTLPFLSSCVHPECKELYYFIDIV